MIEHAGLADAVVQPTFAAATRGHDIVDGDPHLATCPSCRATLAGIRADASSLAALDAGDPSPWVRARVLKAAGSGRSAWRTTVRLLVFAALVVGGLAGGVVGAGALLAQREPQDGPARPDLAALIAAKPVVWRSDAVLLGAESVTLEVNGRTIQAATSATKVSGDSGTLNRATLEVLWLDGGVEQRINLYFAADATTWWMTEARAYDQLAPAPDGKWAILSPLPGRYPLGQAFHGDFDLVGTDRAGPVRVRVRGAILTMVPQSSFAVPPGGGIVLQANPFAAGGHLECSGILLLRPVDAQRALFAQGIRLSWRYVTTTGPNTGTSAVQLEAPQVGYISGAEIGSNGELIVFVEDPERPTAPEATMPARCSGPPPST